MSTFDPQLDMLHSVDPRKVEQTNPWMALRREYERDAIRLRSTYYEKTGVLFDPEDFVRKALIATRERMIKSPKTASEYFATGTIDAAKKRESIVNDTLKYMRVDTTAKTAEVEVPFTEKQLARQAMQKLAAAGLDEEYEPPKKKTETRVVSGRIHDLTQEMEGRRKQTLKRLQQLARDANEARLAKLQATPAEQVAPEEEDWAKGFIDYRQDKASLYRYIGEQKELGVSSKDLGKEIGLPENEVDRIYRMHAMLPMELERVTKVPEYTPAVAPTLAPTPEDTAISAPEDTARWQWPNLFTPPQTEPQDITATSADPYAQMAAARSPMQIPGYDQTVREIPEMQVPEFEGGYEKMSPIGQSVAQITAGLAEFLPGGGPDALAEESPFEGYQGAAIPAPKTIVEHANRMAGQLLGQIPYYIMGYGIINHLVGLFGPAATLGLSQQAIAQEAARAAMPTAKSAIGRIFQKGLQQAGQTAARIGTLSGARKAMELGVSPEPEPFWWDENTYIEPQKEWALEINNAVRDGMIAGALLGFVFGSIGQAYPEAKFAIESWRAGKRVALTKQMTSPEIVKELERLKQEGWELRENGTLYNPGYKDAQGRVMGQGATITVKYAGKKMSLTALLKEHGGIPRGAEYIMGPGSPKATGTVMTTPAPQQPTVQTPVTQQPVVTPPVQTAPTKPVIPPVMPQAQPIIAPIINVGDQVKIVPPEGAMSGSMHEGVFTVVKTDDPSLLTLQNERGNELRVGRSAVQKVEATAGVPEATPSPAIEKPVEATRLDERGIVEGGKQEVQPTEPAKTVKAPFATYEEAQQWITDKSKEYGGKNKFTASDEYKQAYPVIQELHKLGVAKTAEAGQKAMEEAGVMVGDKVAWDYVTPFGVTNYSGTVVDRKGIPYVKFDEGQTTMSGAKSIRWHKGFKTTPGKQEVQPTEPATAKEPVTPIPEAPVKKALPVKAPQSKGKKVTVYSEDNTPFNVSYAVYDVKDLITSHDTNLKINPEYPKELQPRIRERIASELQVAKIAKELNPDRLGENVIITDGAPIVGSDAVVEAGNGRTIALKRVYEQNTAKAKEYRNWITENAEKFGIDINALAKVKNPVLVRIREDEVDREVFTQEGNVPTVAQMSAAEVAIQDAKKLSPKILSQFVPNEDGRIDTAANRKFIRSYIESVASQADRGQLIDATGKELTQDGVRRIRNAIFAKVYGDVNALEKLAEDSNVNVKNQVNAMVNAAPSLLEMKEGISKGEYFPLDITQDIAKAMVQLSALRDTGMSVKDYLKQGQLFGEDLSAIGKDILDIFNKHARSAKRLAGILQEYARQVDVAGNPKQTQIFQENPPTKAEILLRAVEKVEGLDEGQITLFQDEAVGSQRIEAQGREAKETTKTYGHTASQTIAPPAPLTGAQRGSVNKMLKIIDDIVPTRVGKYPVRDRAGIYKWQTAQGDPESISRIAKQFARNIGVNTHEMGHHLDKIVGLSDQRFDSELLEMPYVVSLMSTKKSWTKDRFRKEGTAEFIKMYIMDPEGAQKTATTFYEHFERKLYADQPRIYDKLQDLKAMWNDIQNSTSVDGHIDEFVSNVPSSAHRFSINNLHETFENWKNPISGPIAQLITKLSDSYYPVVRTAEEITGLPLDRTQTWVQIRAGSSDGRLEAALLKGQFVDDNDYATKLITQEGKKSFTRADADKLHNKLYTDRRVVQVLPDPQDKGMWQVFASPKFNKAKFKKVGPSLVEVIAPINNLGKTAADSTAHYNEWIRYMTVKHAIEMEDAGLTSGLVSSEKGITLKSLRDKVKQIEQSEHAPVYIKQLDELIKFRDHVYDWLYKSGLYTEEEKGRILGKWQYHIPFKRVIDPQSGVNTRNPSWRPVKRLMGRDAQIVNPVLSIMREAYLYNRLANAHDNIITFIKEAGEHPIQAARFLDQVPLPQQMTVVSVEEALKQLEPLMDLSEATVFEEGQELQDFVLKFFRPQTHSQKEYLIIRREGKPVAYEVKDKELLNALLSTNREFGTAFGRAAKKLSNLFRMGHITNPVFPWRNVNRDAMIATGYSQTGFVPYATFFDGVMGFLFDSPKVRKAMEGFTAQYDLDEKNLGGSLLKNVIAQDQEWTTMWQHFGGPMRSPDVFNQDALEKMFRRVGIKSAENHFYRAWGSNYNPWQWIKGMATVSEMATNLGDTMRGMKKGMDPLKSVTSGRDATVDHQMIGSATKIIRDLVPFINPRIQGYARLWRQMRDPNRRYQTLLKWLLYITLPSIAHYMLVKDNKNWQEMDRVYKDAWMLIPMGNPKTTDLFLPIPRAHSIVGFAFGAMPARAIEYLYTQDKEAFKEWEKGFGRSVYLSFIPWFITLMYDLKGNRRDYSGIPIESMSDQNKPKRDRYSPYTPEYAKLLGQAFDRSPKKISYAMDTTFGALGRAGLAPIEWGLNMAGIGDPAVKPQNTVAEMPIIGEFFRRAGSYGSNSINKVYELQEKATHIKNSSSGPRNNEERAILSEESNLRTVTKVLGDLRRQSQMIHDHPLLSEKAKREMVDYLDRAQINIARQYFGKEPIPNPLPKFQQ